MSNLRHKNRYTGKREGHSFDRSSTSLKFIGRARLNLANATNKLWVMRGGWSEAQIRRIIRESKVIIGRERQRESNRLVWQERRAHSVANEAISTAASMSKN